MSNQKAQELEQRGIQAARSGQKDQARKLLQHALRLDPTSDNAWLWLASVARDRREKLICLQKVLENNPDNEMGQKAVRAMGIDPERLMPKRPSIADSFAAEDADDSGVPIPDSRLLQELIEQAEAVTAPFRQAVPDLNVEWTRKASGRAGEREIIALRLQIASALAVVLFALGAFAVLAVQNSPALQVTLFGASATPTVPPPTATPTLTPRPDIRATATPQPDLTQVAGFTPTPTLDANIVAWPVDNNRERLYATPTPTRNPNNPENNNALATGVAALSNDRDIEAALQPVRRRQQETSGTTFEPYAYYYEALLLLRQDDPDAALARLDVARGIIEDTGAGAVVSSEDRPGFLAVVAMGEARVDLYRLRQALLVSRRGEAEDYRDAIAERADDALTFNPLLVEPYLVLAEAERLLGDYEAAIETLDRATAFPELVGHETIINLRGQIYLERGEIALSRGETEAAAEQFALAQYTGFLGVYINPFNELAHRLRVQATLALDDPALASIYTNEFLFFRPESVTALVLLAEARLAEGKPDFALDLYSEALGLESGTATTAEIYRSRAELYTQQRRHDLALADLTQAYALMPDLETQFARMQAAFNAGELALARDDAQALIEVGYVRADAARYVLGRALVDLVAAGEGDEADLDVALDLLLGVLDDLPPEERPEARTYVARIFIAQERPADALDALDTAIAAQPSGTRHFLRAQVHEDLGDRQAAIADYEWVILWDTVYQYDFGAAALARRQAILDRIAQEQADATATAAAATQTVLDATATQARANVIATETLIGTFTPTPSPTPTAQPSATGEPAATETPTAPAPDEDPTPTRESG